LVTEYASIGSLRDRLKRLAPGLFPLQESLTILTKIGEALQYSHQKNVVHRDLKPENILFNAKYEPLLADFGIATVLSTLNKNNVTVIGTPAYMAPEQFQGIISRKSDQYALGCIAYELFTGHKPFTASNFAAFMFKHLTENPIAPRQLNPQLPIHIEQAILKSIAKEQGERHTDIFAFISALHTHEISHTFVPAQIVATSEKSNRQPPSFKKQLNENASSHNSLDFPPFVRQAVATLDSAISDERREAIDSLKQTDHPAAQVALVKALEHPIEDVRQMAAYGLIFGVRIKYPEVQKALVKALQHPERDVRVTAAISLSYYEDLRALPILIEASTNDTYDVNDGIYYAIMRLGKEGLQILLKAVNDERKEIRRGAISTLRRNLSGLSLDSRSFLVDEQARMDLLPTVLAVLKAPHDDYELKHTLSAIEHAARYMLFGLEDSQSNLEIRRYSAWALSITLPGLLQVLVETNDRDLINKTAEFINRIAKPIMRKARKDRDEYVRNTATWTFDKIKK
jgi:HEAT repeat protein